jgi:hypothetical protein
LSSAVVCTSALVPADENPSAFAPFLLSSFGYRINQRSFFVETQVGIGGNYEIDYSSICGFIGIEPGIHRKRWIFSIDYRFITSDGFIEGDHFHALSFKTGYRIFGAE